MTFAEIFKTARLTKKLTQQQIADALHLDRSAIAHYEKGDAMPNARNIYKICQILDISPDVLLNTDEND